MKLAELERNQTAYISELPGNAQMKIQDIYEAKKRKQRLDPKCWKGYRKDGTKIDNGVKVNNCVKVSEDEYTYEGELSMLYDELEILDEAEYQGRKVKLGKPITRRC